MATLRDTLKYAKENPNDPRNGELFKALKSGVFDEKAKQEGIDISGIRPEFDSNIGIGFEAPFQFTGEETALQATGKTLGNVPRSGGELVKNVFSAVTSPVDTVKSVFGLIKGSGAKAAREVTERISPETASQVQQSPEEQQFNQFLGFIKDRYGSVDRFKETVVEDPVGALADIAAVATGVGSAIKATGTAGKLGTLERVGGTVSRAGQIADPASIAARTASTVAKATSGATSRAARVISEVIPGFSEVKEKAVTRALDLTQGDVARFNQRRGITPGEYITQKTVQIDGQNVPLLGNTVEDTAQNINTLKNNSYTELRSKLAQVDQTYGADEVPRVKNTLQSIASDLEGVPGLEDDLAEVQRLLSKEEYTLTDVQRAKEIFDERYNIFNKSGDPKAGDRAAGLKNVREDIREFIETEGDKYGIDVRQLNDDVSVAYELEKAIEKGATRDMTRNELGLTDNIVGSALAGGAIFGGISPLTAAGLFLAKRTMSSPTFKLAVAQAVSKLGDVKARALTEALRAGKLTPEQTQLLRGIIEEAQSVMPVIESGSKVIEETSPMLGNQEEQE